MEIAENTLKIFSFVGHFQQKEFVGQKALNPDNQEVISGDNVKEVLDTIWEKVQPLIKREVLVEGESFQWSSQENHSREEIGKFVTFQDKSNRKNYTIEQISTDVLRKIRDKDINIMVHVYSRNIINKNIHTKMVEKLIQPEQRDRANANTTISVIELVQKLKQTHNHLTANMSAWNMWANAIHSAPAHLQEAMMNELPPVHMINYFRSASIPESQNIRLIQNGLQVADNLNDTYSGHLAMLREDFDNMKQSVINHFNMYDLKLRAAEEVAASNSRIVASMNGSLQIQESSVSIAEEQQISDFPDIDHNLY